MWHGVLIAAWPVYAVAAISAVVAIVLTSLVMGALPPPLTLFIVAGFLVGLVVFLTARERMEP